MKMNKQVFLATQKETTPMKSFGSRNGPSEEAIIINLYDF